MSKDPAFLFYTSDFITGTIFMTNEQVGIYIRLLCAQHQHGGLIDKRSFNDIVGNHDLVRNKFIETDAGFFNERLTKEMIRRSKKSSNLSLNAQKRWSNHKNNASSMQLHSNCNADAWDPHMRTENENENENEEAFKDIGQLKQDNKAVKRFTPPTIEEVTRYCLERKNSIKPSMFIDYYQARGWELSRGRKIKDWKACIRIWEANDHGPKSHNQRPL